MSAPMLRADIDAALSDEQRAWLLESIRLLVHDEVARVHAASAEPDIFEKLFTLAPLRGDYVEFGVFQGHSMVRAYRAAEAWTRQLLNGRADHLVDDKAALRERVQALWAERRFIGFDSFEGMPEPTGVDRERVIWKPGTFEIAPEEFFRRVEGAGVPDEKLLAVKGFFHETLVPEMREHIGLDRVAVVHIDSDLYESARLALEFVTPALQNGTAILFDEWFAYRGHPDQGEQLAFREWQAAHPEWLVTEYQCAGVTSKAFLVNHATNRPQWRDALAELLE